MSVQNAVFFLALLFAFASGALAAETYRLELEDLHESSSPLEISGFVFRGGELHAVSDNSWDTWLYRLGLAPGKARAAKALNLKALEGYWPYYFSTLLWRQGGRWAKAAWDLEGATACGDDIYLVNEQARHILKVAENKLEKVDIDFSEIFQRMGAPLPSVAANAGFEGLALDCQNMIAYIAQERAPRAILAVDIKDKKVLEHFSTPSEGNPHPDYAGVFYENGHLYILERNTRRILKVSIANKEVVAVADYAELEEGFPTEDLYETGEPFGLGEALLMDEKFVYVGMDNNGNSFSQEAKRRFAIESENNSCALKFKRPAGF